MNRTQSALFRGKVGIRPWRVGLIIDVNDQDQVRDAISALTAVWGGIFMPILDHNVSIEEMQSAAKRFDVDSLYASESASAPSEELEELLRAPGYCWHGRDDWGPFTPNEGRYSKGLLPANALRSDMQFPPWYGPTSDDLIIHAYLGRTSSPVPQSRPILETASRIDLAGSYGRSVPSGLCVVRKDTPRDVVWYWNCRSLGGTAYPLAAESVVFNEAVLEELVLDSPISDRASGGAGRGIIVWGLEDLGSAERIALEAWARLSDVELISDERDDSLNQYWFSGVERTNTSLFRTETVSTAHEIYVATPSLPLANDDIGPGIVAAEVDFHEASGVDPRLSVSIPPYRQHAQLFGRALVRGSNEVRVSRVGPVFGVQANADEISIPLPYNLDIMHKLFDDSTVSVTQSNEGQFQMRAAEMFGGATVGFFAQPGLRSAVMRVADRTIGVTLDELRQIITRDRGEWPYGILREDFSVSDYSRHQSNILLNSGLLVPTLDVECTHCRVVSRVNPDDLAANVLCEFCGEESRLALSLALTKPRWRYRLAAHVAAEKIRAFLPAMAAAGVLSDFQHVEAPPPSHVFGLTVTQYGKHPIEADIATILHEDRWTVVLGEVKNHHPIDANDVENLKSLQILLSSKGVPCVVLFATLKDTFSEDEKGIIRASIDRMRTTTTRRGRAVTLAPLVLTKRDMSLHPLHEDHPWRWGELGDGVFGIALESCKRNLDWQPP